MEKPAAVSNSKSRAKALSFLMLVSLALGSWLFKDADSFFILSAAYAYSIPFYLTIGLFTATSVYFYCRQPLREKRLSEQILGQFVEASYDPILIINRDGIIEFVNRRIQATFGYSPQELIGRPVETLVPVHLREKHIGYRMDPEKINLPRPMGSGRNLIGITKSGKEIPVDISLSRIKANKTQMIAAIIRDLTETKILEIRQKHLSDLTKVLHRSLDRDETLKALGSFCAAHLCDWCNVYVFETNEVKRIGPFHSDPTQKALGNQLAATALPTALEQVIHDVVATRKSHLKQDIDEGSVQSAVQNEHVAKLYSKLGIHSFIAVPIAREHQVFAVMTVIKSQSNFEIGDMPFFEDIADRTTAALENARLYQLALSAIKKRENMVAVVSHDLNSPLSAIQMGADMLLRHLDQNASVDCTQEIKKRVEGIRHSVALASQLTNNILDMAKIDSGNLFIARNSIEPALPIQNAEKLLVQLAEGKQIQVQVDMQCKDRIDADLDRLNQVFANLIGNALKFTPRKGQIRIGVKTQNRDALFYVSDTGVGIHKDFLPHLFDMYSQAEKSASKSLGLGLAIVHGIVEAHGGRIWAESEVGKGSTFYFTIPLSSTKS